MSSQEIFSSTVLTPVQQRKLREEFTVNGFVKINQAFTGKDLSQIQREVRKFRPHRGRRRSPAQSRRRTVMSFAQVGSMSLEARAAGAKPGSTRMH